MRKHFDFINDDIIRAGIALHGGGHSATSGSCGIYSGGLMALSAKLGPRSPNPSQQDKEAFEEVRRKIDEFRDWFITEFGGVTCRDVQLHLFGRFFNLMDEGVLQEFKDYQKLHGIKCNQAITEAAFKVAEILCSEEDTSDGSRELRQ